MPPVLHGEAEAGGHGWPGRAVPAPVRSAPDPWSVVPKQDHFYGGQAVLEGVMMRGRQHWAIAVRRPDQSIHLEVHEIKSIGRRFPILLKPGVRGILALGQALSIGVRALTISANQSVEDDKKLTPRQMGVSMVLAFLLFTTVFIALPYLGFGLFRRSVPS